MPSLDCYLKPLLPDSIRLLRLLPDDDRNAPVHCELFHCSLQDAGKRTHPYDALSYVWGKPQPIFIREHNSTSGHDLLVTENLHVALLRLRNFFTGRIMWIDAVSFYSHRTVKIHRRTLKFTSHFSEGPHFTYLAGLSGQYILLCF